MTVRVGIVGAGVMRTDHARTLQRSVSGATVTAVADPVTDRARAVAAETGARRFSSAEELIASPFVDAVLVASHDSAHVEQVISCLEHRKPVLCEKPLAPTVRECQELVDHQNAITADSPLISVGFVRRFHPAYRALKARLEEGAAGQPLMVLSSHRNRTSAPDWNSASTMTNASIHDIDITAWLLNSPIESVSCHAPRTTATDSSGQDAQVLHLRTADGVLTVVDVLSDAQYGYDVRCEIVGELDTVELARPRVTPESRAMTESRSPAADWRPVFADAYRLQFQAWIDALASGARSALATAEDALTAARVAEAIVSSRNSGGAAITISHAQPTAGGSSAGRNHERTLTHVR